MTLEEFYGIIDNCKDYVVKLAYKYHNERDYTVSNQVLCGCDGIHMWLYDWDEGQSNPKYGDVKVLGYIEVADVNVPEF